MVYLLNEIIKMEENEFNIVLVMILAVAFVICATIVYERLSIEGEINETKPTLTWSNETNNWVAYFNENDNILKVNQENCKEVICECAKNTRTPCMALCYYCEEDLNSK